MATVFLTFRRYRVTVYPDDHPPPHVHAVGKGRNARYKLNCPVGPVELWDSNGDWTSSQLNEIGREIAGRLSDCCRFWANFHG